MLHPSQKLPRASVVLGNSRLLICAVLRVDRNVPRAARCGLGDNGAAAGGRVGVRERVVIVIVIGAGVTLINGGVVAGAGANDYLVQPGRTEGGLHCVASADLLDHGFVAGQYGTRRIGDILSVSGAGRKSQGGDTNDGKLLHCSIS